MNGQVMMCKRQEGLKEGTNCQGALKALEVGKQGNKFSHQESPKETTPTDDTLTLIL